jgi:tetratricopeptide (TPR) repeat protein
MEDQLKKGETLFADGRIDDAENCFLSVVEKDANNKEAHNNLGVVAIQKQDIKGAIECFTRSLELDPFYKEAIVNYTDLLGVLNQPQIAVPFLEKILEINPDDEEISQLLKEVLDPQDYLTNKDETKSSVEVCHASSNEESHLSDVDVLLGKKVLHAPFEIAGNMNRITKYLKLQNIDATSANYYDSWLKYKCDVNLNVNNLPESERSKAIDNFAKDAIDKYDIFHFHFAHSLYPDFRDLEELKQKGKKIIFHFWGSDQRSPEWIFYHQAIFLGYNPPKPFFNTLQQYHVHKIINRYADVMIGLTCIPRGIFIPGSTNTSEWNLEEKEKILKGQIVKKDPKKTYFVHAPSENWKKGSSVILKLFEECKQDGMPIELLYVNKMTQLNAKQIYAYADYAIDQVGVGTFGLFGVEMMCWQIPVLVYQIDLLERLRNYPPIIKITKDTFKRQIAKCIEMKKSGENVELGKKSRNWAIENVDISLGIHEYLKIYRDLAEGKQVKQYVNKSWYEQEYLLQNGIKSEFYKYMIENKVFDEMQMKTPVYDKKLYVE